LLTSIRFWSGSRKVDAEDGAGGAGAFGRAFLDGDVVYGEFLDNPFQRLGGNQAQVGAAGRWAVGLRLELVTGPVQVDLAVTEGQGGASRAERHRLHAQHAGVERHGGVDVGDGQHQVVEAIDAHKLIVGGRWGVDFSSLKIEAGAAGALAADGKRSAAGWWPAGGPQDNLRAYGEAP
jgi:hypothetical protein